MKRFALILLAFTASIGGAESSADLKGSWIVKIENPRHQLITTMTIRFTDLPARSCMGGEWKRVFVDSVETANHGFFPADEPLSWQMENGTLTIGRNEVCDGYLQLAGKLKGSVVNGDFYSLGLEGSHSQGRFSMSRDSRTPGLPASDNRLVGTWRSDPERSLRFALSHSVLEEKQQEFLEGVLGRLELTFDSSRMRNRMPDVDVPVQGKAQHFQGSDQTYDYTILGTDEDSMAILVKGLYGKDRIWHLHFAAEDEFWIYSEDGDYGLRDLNFREYFRKMR